MRKQILGATAAILGASALSIGLPAATTHGAAWKPTTPIPFPAGVVTDVEVVSTGPGDAVAAAIINGAVHAYTATDGAWVGHDEVRGDVDATGLLLAANGNGDAVVAWEEVVSGDNRLRASRQFSSTAWLGQQFLTPAGSDIIGGADIGIAANGLVIATASVDEAEAHQKLLVTEWPEGQVPGTPQVLSGSDSWGPSLDVNKKGEALVAYNYSGIIEDVVNVVRRTPGQGWNLGDSTSNDGNVAAGPDVAISDNGQGQVIYAVTANDAYVVQTSRVLPDGNALPDAALGPFDEFAADPSVDINATGAALFTWVSHKNGTTTVRYASAANDAYPGAAQVLSGTASNATDPTARISDSGLRVIQHSGNGQVVTHTKTHAAQPFVPVYSGTGFHTDDAVDVDRDGNAVQVAFKPVGGVSGRFFDATGPTATLNAVPYATIAKTIPVSWTASDSLSALTGTDVYVSSVAWNKTVFSTPEVVVHDVPGTEATVPAIAGTTYCIQTRTSDAANNSTTTPKRCTTVPLDDRALVGNSWNRATGTGHFKNTVTTTKQNGAVLTRTNVKAKKLVLVVQKTANSGTVKVTFDGQVLGSFSLEGSGKKKQISLGSFPAVKAGTLTIKVTSATGKPVNIDGLIVAK